MTNRVCHSEKDNVVETPTEVPHSVKTKTENADIFFNDDLKKLKEGTLEITDSAETADVGQQEETEETEEFELSTEEETEAVSDVYITFE